MYQIRLQKINLTNHYLYSIQSHCKFVIHFLTKKYSYENLMNEVDKIIKICVWK